VDAGTETMTIYDVLRHVVQKVPWDSREGGNVLEEKRKRAATTLIDRLEEQGLLGQIGLTITEDF
jgi:hypothetical protein